MKSFDPDDESSPTYYLTWYWRQRGMLSHQLSDWLPSDKLFHAYASELLGWRPDPVHEPSACAVYDNRLWAAARTWCHLFMRHHEGKRMFSVERDDDYSEEADE